MSSSRALAGLVLAGALLAGCSSDGGGADETGSADDSAATSSSSTSSPASSSTSPTSTLDTSEGSQASPEGVVRKITRATEDADSAQVKIDAEINGTKVTATGPQSIADDAVDIALDLGGSQILYRKVGEQYFVSNGDAWTRVDTSTQDGEAIVGQVQLMSVQSQLEAMETSVEQVRDLGTATVQSRELRHYRFVCDRAELLTALGQPAQDGEIVYDVWLNRDGTMRRIAVPLDGISMTIAFDAWGEPVNIPRPTTG